ncbi:hypothetical protein ACHAWF_001624 [Thalassiosira exigua]
MEAGVDEGNQGMLEHASEDAATRPQKGKTVDSTESQMLFEEEQEEKDEGFSDFLAYIEGTPPPLGIDNIPTDHDEEAPKPDSQIAADWKDANLTAEQMDEAIKAVIDSSGDALMSAAQIAEYFEKATGGDKSEKNARSRPEVLDDSVAPITIEGIVGTSQEVEKSDAEKRPELADDSSSPEPDEQIGTMQDDLGNLANRELVPNEKVSTTHHACDLQSKSSPNSANQEQQPPSEASPDGVSNQVQDGSQQQMPVIYRPPSPSMLQHQSSSSMHAPMVEATLVEDEPVIDTVAVPMKIDSGNDVANDDDHESPQPWWKEHQRLIVVILLLFIAALIAILGASLLGQNNGNPGDSSALIDGSFPTRSQFGAPTSSPMKGSTQQSSPPTNDKEEQPIRDPTEIPTKQMYTVNPTQRPSQPSSESASLIAEPTSSSRPTLSPSKEPTQKLPSPTVDILSKNRTEIPTTGNISTENPTQHPSQPPTEISTRDPSQPPSQSPTRSPSLKPTISPTKLSTRSPTKSPSPYPTHQPSQRPSTKRPTRKPTQFPTNSPTTALESTIRKIATTLHGGLKQDGCMFDV